MLRTVLRGKAESKGKSKPASGIFFKQLYGPINNPAASFSAAYITALIIIAFASMQSHMLTLHIVNKQEDAARISFFLSSMRSEAQRVLFYAENYGNFAPDSEQALQESTSDGISNSGKMIDLALLEMTIENFSGSHQILKERIVQKGWFGIPIYPYLYDSFFVASSQADGRLHNFIEKTKEYISTDIYEPDKREELLKYIQFEVKGPMGMLLDNILINYQTRVLEENEKYAAWKAWSLVIVLIVLLLEALFIFRPLVKQTKKYHDVLHHLAYEDPLTGINNRRAFTKRANIMIQQAKREKKPVAVILCDLDFFKRVNDTYGHDAGDTVLRHFTKIMNVSMRPGDLTGRLGGEEFAILISGASLPAAKKMIERLRRKMEETPCEYKKKKEVTIIRYTASFGIAGISGGRTSIDDLLKTADANLYRAKENGRNTIVASKHLHESESTPAESHE